MKLKQPIHGWLKKFPLFTVYDRHSWNMEGPCKFHSMYAKTKKHLERGKLLSKVKGCCHLTEPCSSNRQDINLISPITPFPPSPSCPPNPPSPLQPSLFSGIWKKNFFFFGSIKTGCILQSRKMAWSDVHTICKGFSTRMVYLKHDI